MPSNRCLWRCYSSICDRHMLGTPAMLSRIARARIIQVRSSWAHATSSNFSCSHRQLSWLTRNFCWKTFRSLMLIFFLFCLNSMPILGGCVSLCYITASLHLYLLKYGKDWDILTQEILLLAMDVQWALFVLVSWCNLRSTYLNSLSFKL
jgi:hypothetical protein